MAVPIPMPRPSNTSPSSPGILDQVLEFGGGALDLFQEYLGIKGASNTAASLAEAEKAKLAQLEAQKHGTAAPGSETVYATSAMPSWLMPVAIAAGVGILVIAVLKK